MTELPIDIVKTEAAAGRVAALCTELGLNREEVTSTLLTVAVNHMVATRVTAERAALAVLELYCYRPSHGLNERLLVPDIE
jgi:hypothetical protein